MELSVLVMKDFLLTYITLDVSVLRALSATLMIPALNHVQAVK